MMAIAQEKMINGVKTRSLHGKDYVEVAERVRMAHAQESHDFEIIESEPYEIAGRVIWRVTISVGGRQYKGNAEAKLSAAKNTPDGTNPFECAETSAIGRALGFAGLGTVDSIASYEEVARGQTFDQAATTQQQQAKAALPAQSGKQFAKVDRRELPADLKDIPTAAQIRRNLEAACLPDVNGEPLTWEGLLASAFAGPIAAGKYTLQRLIDAGDELPPSYCAVLCKATGYSAKK